LLNCSAKREHGSKHKHMMRVADTTNRMWQQHRGIACIAEALHNLHTVAGCTAVTRMFERPVELMALLQQHCCRRLPFIQL
jgi:hypothetical protein